MPRKSHLSVPNECTRHPGNWKVKQGYDPINRILSLEYNCLMCERELWDTGCGREGFVNYLHSAGDCIRCP